MGFVRLNPRFDRFLALQKADWQYPAAIRTARLAPDWRFYTSASEFRELSRAGAQRAEVSL